MSFIYNADSEKVIDGDVKLETVEDLNREIKNITDDIIDMEADLETGSTSIPTERFIMRRVAQWKKMLKTLLELKKDRFGSDATSEEKKIDKKIALLDTKLSNLTKKILSHLKKKRRLDLLFEVTLKE